MKTTFQIHYLIGILFFCIGFQVIGCEDTELKTQKPVENAKTSQQVTQNSTPLTGANCDEITGSKEKDECLYNLMETLEARDIDKVYQSAQQIQDSMVQGAAVSKWIKMNNNQLNPNQGKRLCELLQGRDQFYCLRRLSSPHLKK